MTATALRSFLIRIGEILRILSQHNPFFLFSHPKVRGKLIPYLHQVEFLLRVMFRRPIRVLLADEIGLGKTISALMVIRKLYDNNELKRVLIVVPRILVNQWFSEILRAGFEAPRRIERYTIDRLVREGFPEGIYLASMDLIKRREYFNKIAEVDWDMIVVDEAHRLGAKRNERTQRYERIGLGLIYSRPERHALLLSATPHRGDPSDYLARLILLDPFLEPGGSLNSVFFYAKTHNVLVFRRTKIDVNNVYEKRKIFTDCKLEAIIVAANQYEKEFHERLVRFLRTKLLEFYDKSGIEPRALGLLMALIFKRASSSPYAALVTMERIIERRAYFLQGVIDDRFIRGIKHDTRTLAGTILGIGYEDYPETMYDGSLRDIDEMINDFAARCSVFLTDADIREIRKLMELANKIKENDSRLLTLINLVKMYIEEGRKIVIFTEYKDTVEYIYQALSKEIGCEKIVIVTGDTVRDSMRFERIKKKFEQNPQCMVMIATDVASEGLNLQVASIAINYEPPWSPVKLEQRMGRVWRLGQKRDVIIHNIFLGVQSDKDVLDVLYKKLIAMGRAFSIKKPVIGEEVVVFDFPKQESMLQPIELKERRRKIRLTEYTLIKEYLRGGREGLDLLVRKMLAAIRRLKENLKRLCVVSSLDDKLLHEIIYGSAGFSNFSEYKETLLRLAREIFQKYVYFDKSIKIFIDKNNVINIVTREGGVIAIDDPRSALVAIDRVLEEIREEGDIVRDFIVIDDRDGELIVYDANIVLLPQNTLVYREPIGVFFSYGKNEVKIVRGKNLLSLLTEILNKQILAGEDLKAIDQKEVELIAKSKISGELRTMIHQLLREYTLYIENLESRNLRRGRGIWCPDPNMSNIRIDIRKKLLRIRFLKSPGSITGEIPEEEKRRIEEIAMQIALEYEKKAGRQPTRVDDREHYDIHSVDPRTGEERYIEVKGHRDAVLVAELTEAEYALAREKRGKYWLYIVHSINKRPQLIAIRDPISKLKVQVTEEIDVVKRKRYLISLE